MLKKLLACSSLALIISHEIADDFAFDRILSKFNLAFFTLFLASYISLLFLKLLALLFLSTSFDRLNCSFSN